MLLLAILIASIFPMCCYIYHLCNFSGGILKHNWWKDILIVRLEENSGQLYFFSCQL